MSDKFNPIVPVTVYKPVPYGGVRSSNDMNTFMDSTRSDIYELIRVFNEKLMPILNGLPLGEVVPSLDAVLEGLSAACMYIDPSVNAASTNASYYYHSASPTRPNTVKEVTDALITKIGTLDSSIAAINSQLTSINTNIDIAPLLAELSDIRQTISNILIVLRNLKFYSDWERIHALTVLADPDTTKAPLQTLIGLGPAVKFAANVNNNLFINFSVPRNIDVAQPIICNFTYCLDSPSSAGAAVKVKTQYQVVSSTGNVKNAPVVSLADQTLSAPTNAFDVGQFTANTLALQATAVHDLINFQFTRDVSVAGNNTGSFYILDISFYGKRLELPGLSL